MPSALDQAVARCDTILAQCLIAANQAAEAAAVTAGSGLAPLVSPHFQGVPTAPTPPPNESSNTIITAGWVAGKLGVASGIATLDNVGLVPIAQLPFSTTTFDGIWNAATNTPTLASSSGTAGHYRIVQVSGSTTLNGISSWGIGDQAIFNGSVWQKIPYIAPPVVGLSLSSLEAIATATVVGNISGGSATPSALTISSITSFLSTMVGDSGSGGVKGLVPAAPPMSGTGSFLRADGTFATLPLPDLSIYATLANPAFTGTATVSTQALHNYGSAIASTAFVGNEFAGSPTLSGTITLAGRTTVSGTAGFLVPTGPVIISVGGGALQVPNGNANVGGNLSVGGIGVTGTMSAASLVITGSGDISGVKNVFANAVTTTGNASFGGSVSVTGGLAAAGITSNGDFTSVRPGSPTTGALFLGNSGTRFIFFDGSVFDINGPVAATGGFTINATNSNFVPYGPGGSGYQCKHASGGFLGGNIFNLWYDGIGNTYLFIDFATMGIISITSDYRIKKDVAYLDSTWDAVKNLRPIKYTTKEFERDGKPFIRNDDKEKWGFLAHELQDTLIEDAATGEKDTTEGLQSPNQWPIIAALTRALQEAMARIEVLEGKI